MTQPPHVPAPVASAVAAPRPHPFAVVSLILGIVSVSLLVLTLLSVTIDLRLFAAGSLNITFGPPFLASFLAGLAGIVFGHAGRAVTRRQDQARTGNGIETAGLVLSYAGAILSAALFAFVTPVFVTRTPA